MRVVRSVVILSCLQAALTARILGVFPTPSVSHQVVFRALTTELARRGHQLLVLTTDPAPLAHPNLTEIDAHDISYKLWQERVLSKLFEAKRNGHLSIVNQYRLCSDATLDLLDAQMSLPEVQSLILNNKEEPFDLILLESPFRALFPLRHRFKVPLVAVSSLGGFAHMYDSMGIPSHPVFFPDMLSTKISNFGLFDKIYAVYTQMMKYYINAQVMPAMEEFARKHFGDDVPSIPELESQTDLLILNVNPIWDGSKLTPPNVIYMWGAHLQPPKELPEDLKAFLDASARGVVYMSLGSNMKSSELSAERLRVFLDAFRRLPHDVLWKWEADELAGRPHNVRVAKWLPQADLLRHPNVKAFITQGGLQSTDEALQAGVPLVGIPMFMDQEINVERYEIHGFGIGLDIETLTADRLLDAIKLVIENEKYRTAGRRLARLLADGDGSVARAAWWVEYVMRHGGARHLRSPAAGVSFAEYYMLDVVAVLSLAAAVACAVVLFTLYYTCSKLMCALRRTNKNNRK